MIKKKGRFHNSVHIIILKILETHLSIGLNKENMGEEKKKKERKNLPREREKNEEILEKIKLEMMIGIQ